MPPWYSWSGEPLPETPMSDQTIEKSFLYLLLVSLVIHLAIFLVMSRLPVARPLVPPEP